MRAPDDISAAGAAWTPDPRDTGADLEPDASTGGAGIASGRSGRVAAARAGDPRALDELFSEYFPRLVAFLRMKAGQVIRARESAHDLAQSVCREVLMDIEDFDERDDDAFRRWLFVQATRKIIDRRRSHGRARRDVLREQSGDEPGSADAELVVEGYATFCTPSRHVAASEELRRIELTLARLPESQRDAVALTRLAGLSNAEAAEHLGCSESAVRGLVARGLAKLSTLLGDG